METPKSITKRKPLQTAEEELFLGLAVVATGLFGIISGVWILQFLAG
jgi:hypothetical protein